MSVGADHAGRLRLPRVEEYAERVDAEASALDRFGANLVASVVANAAGLRHHRFRPILRHMARHDARLKALGDDDLRAEARAVRLRLRSALRGHRLPVAAAGEAFALLRETAERVLGKRPYDVQAIGAWAMMNGHVAEMRTGDGKSLSAVLAAATVALSGRQVHLLTVNDYLVTRDAEEFAAFYGFLGLTVSTVVAGQDGDTRRTAYGADVVYATNKEVAFDFLRDRAMLRHAPGNLRRKVDRLAPSGGGVSGLRLPGLPVAFVDEADSVLIDEARTPLVISGQSTMRGGFDDAVFTAAMAAARQLGAGTDYRIPRGTRTVEILEPGFDRLDQMTDDRDDAFAIPVIRDHMVLQALKALEIFHRGEAYILRDDKVQIVDENTGRVTPDRQWSDGLHQMVELKEGLEMSATRETLSRMTYQRFFRRYAHLGGMTGTARDAAWELATVYGLSVVRIPTNAPDRRIFARDRLYRHEDDKLAAIAARAGALAAAGVPVLIGTRSINASEAVSDRLTAAGLDHQLLSAAQDADEAAIVAEAGQPGRITVATNMAGRGTDIKLAGGVTDVGGLHVILTERHDSRRIDRQFEGRCGRQGDPGHVEAYLSLEDELMRGPDAARWRAVAAGLMRMFGPRAAGWVLRRRQLRVERLHARMRRDLMENDRSLGRLLAMSGELE